jgi:hypothetical protein
MCVTERAAPRSRAREALGVAALHLRPIAVSRSDSGPCINRFQVYSQVARFLRVASACETTGVSSSPVFLPSSGSCL